MEQTEKVTFNSKLTALFVKSRFAIIIVLLTLIVAAVVIGVVITIKDNSVEKGLTALDRIEFKYESLDSSSDSFASDQKALLTEAKDLATKSSGIVAVRSYLFVADVEFSLENIEDARDAYLSAYEGNDTAYTAPIALYNAAVASEELNDLDASIDYLNKAVAYDDFTLASRALFNVGRIEESRGNYSEAVSAYQQINDEYPSSTWAKLAKSRLISLKAENKA